MSSPVRIPSGVLVSRDEHCAVESPCSRGHLADATSTSTRPTSTLFLSPTGTVAQSGALARSNRGPVLYKAPTGVTWLSFFSVYSN
ncbi:uncharacterized protein SCHCODRAFT_02629250 [Schizophyllum commune H4-8]|uniref:uncharacterized protein n=1 Tax=Schizophyllum commune (strain H4-8 / FGSC 9210) TaxID=578458 RepID=UPI00215F9356|nr:uncharacterized protein SCHCODRAFT_02629250 [Schizophyllum commune H4-8]KAI5891490.1 hypothetical protein SCHCODRAFT_02629250 [Schizophyllum commune H4-8]